MQEEIPSPCIGVCRIQRHSGLCEGCLRHIDDIEAWPALTSAEKSAALQRIEQRRAALARLQGKK